MAPPTISLTHHGATATPSKMILSPPRINLRRASSYTSDRGPLSSSSSRFNFDHLAFASPPPSPGLPLPQLAPRRRHTSYSSSSSSLSQAPRPSRVLRALLWLTGTLVLLYVANKSSSSLLFLSYSSSRQQQQQTIPDIFSFGGKRRKKTGKAETEEDASYYEMVGQDNLPDFPTPIVATDRRGRAQWTVSIPSDAEFPLAPATYADICAKCHEVAARVAGIRHSRGPTDKRDDDKYFLPISKAQAQGILPPAQKPSGREIGFDGDDGTQKPTTTATCASSLTFVLASDDSHDDDNNNNNNNNNNDYSDAGLGTTLLALWTAYGIAQREGRAFFVEDARWAYGRYGGGLFAPPPDPGCAPPAWTERVPCPRSADHLVVVGGRMLLEQGLLVEDDDGDHDKEIFALARQGYEALFTLVEPDRGYVAQRVEGLAGRGGAVGVHVRRGDRRPLEFQYANSYIPLDKYASVAAELMADDQRAPVMVLASDDPLVYEADELAGAERAQELIRLAGKDDAQQKPSSSSSSSSSNKYVMHKFEEEAFGWEGGFFAAMFRHLGASSGHDEAVRLRSLMGRAYLMDLAVVAASEHGVVCAVSAAGCRVLAVMMGDDRAFAQGLWRNIDGGFGWTAFV